MLLSQGWKGQGAEKEAGEEGAAVPWGSWAKLLGSRWQAPGPRVATKHTLSLHLALLPRGCGAHPRSPGQPTEGHSFGTSELSSWGLHKVDLRRTPLAPKPRCKILLETDSRSP